MTSKALNALQVLGIGTLSIYGVKHVLIAQLSPYFGLNMSLIAHRSPNLGQRYKNNIKTVWDLTLKSQLKELISITWATIHTYSLLSFGGIPDERDICVFTQTIKIRWR